MARITPSSTSNSERRHRRGRPAVVIFVAALIVGGAALQLYLSRLSTEARMVTAPESVERMPEGGDLYPAYVFGNGIDHFVYYWGTRPKVDDSVRTADVLFCGTSRVMFGLSDDLIADFFSRLHLRYHMLGFGYAETDDFTLSILRRLSPHPKFIIANEDGFFKPGYGLYATKVMSGGFKNAWEFEYEEQMTFRYREYVHRFLPRLSSIQTFSAFFFRSQRTGAWVMAGSQSASYPLTPAAPSGPPSSEELASAREFQAQCRSLGAQMILISVPSPTSDLGRTLALAHLLNVPSVIPDLDTRKLFTFDGSHLNQASAAIYTRALLSAAAPLFERAASESEH